MAPPVGLLAFVLPCAVAWMPGSVRAPSPSCVDNRLRSAAPRCIATSWTLGTQPSTVLGVPPDASQDEIRKAFRRRARTLHPDVNGSPDAALQFQQLVYAFEVLSDPVRSQRAHAAQTGTPARAPDFQARATEGRKIRSLFVALGWLKELVLLSALLSLWH